MLNANGMNLRALHSEHIAKLQQIADNAAGRGEHDKARRFLSEVQKYQQLG